MKKIKLTIGGFFFALLVGIISMNINPTRNTPDTGDLTLMNAEALAQGELGGIGCAGSGNVSCGNGLYAFKLTIY